MFGKYIHPLPESFKRLKEGDRLTFAGHTWEVLVGRGHSPEHACFFDAERNLFIAGDQLLPTISSNLKFIQRNRRRTHSKTGSSHCEC